MEYRGVDTKSKKQLFIQGPFEEGTNNIGEFLAIVHGLALLKKNNRNHIFLNSTKQIPLGLIPYVNGLITSQAHIDKDKAMSS